MEVEGGRMEGREGRGRENGGERGKREENGRGGRKMLAREATFLSPNLPKAVEQ